LADLLNENQASNSESELQSPMLGKLRPNRHSVAMMLEYESDS